MPNTATLYARFSSAEQAKGSSIERQLSLCGELAKRNDWIVTTVLKDEGKSAFAGMNRAEGGQLFEFEQKALRGDFRNGHIFIVEHLDRISRQGYEEVLSFLSNLTKNGVTVATVDGSNIYKANERVPMGPVIEIVLKAELAMKEIERKAGLIKQSWKLKIDKAVKGSRTAVTSIVPAWIDVDPVTREMTLNQKRVDLIKEIFELTINGHGGVAIARMLNERNEPVWEYRGRSSNRGWYNGYISKLFNNRALLGEYVPHDSPRHGTRKPTDITIMDYYPQAIEAAVFDRATLARKERKHTSGAWKKTHNNLLSGIAKCFHCGGPMLFIAQAQAGTLRTTVSKGKTYTSVVKRSVNYLKCDGGSRGQSKCINTARIRYENIEPAILEQVLNRRVGDRDVATQRKVTSLEVDLAEAERFLADKRKRLDNLVDSYARTGSAAVEKAMLALEAETASDQQRIDTLKEALTAQKAEPTATEQQAIILSVRNALNSTDEQVRNEARIRIKQLMPKIITSMTCDDEKITHIILGDNAAGMFFDGDGKCVGAAILQTEIIGPDGERNWVPD